MSVHPDRGARVIRWLQDGRQRSRRFDTEPHSETPWPGGAGAPA